MWVTQAQIDSFTDYTDSGFWSALDAAGKTRVVKLVSARWASFAWKEGKQPELIRKTDTVRKLDESLLAAFALHCVHVATLSGNANISADADDDDPNIMSDVPEYSRNILLTGYVYTDDQFAAFGDQAPVRRSIGLAFTPVTGTATN